MAKINVLNRRELALALTYADCDRICKPLDRAGIPYIIRSFSTTGNMGRMRGRTGTLGVNMDCAYQYRIYIHKSDYDRALSLRE